MRVLFLLFSFLPVFAYAQHNANLQHEGIFPEYKSIYKDSLLFKENDQGNIIMSGIVSCMYSKTEILTDFPAWLREQKLFSNSISIGQEVLRVNSYSCRIELNVGKGLFTLFTWWTPVFTFARAKSEISFTLKVIAKDGKYHYQLSDFYTERRRIHGEAKEHGQSNEIHFQRLHCLLTELSTLKKKDDIEEYNQTIKDERLQYKAEYATVQNFIKLMKNTACQEELNF